LMRGRTGAAGDFGGLEPLEGGDAVPFAVADDAFPGVALRGGGGGPEPAAFAEIGVNGMRGAEGADFIYRGFGSLRDAQGFGDAEEFFKRGELRHPGQDEAAVAAGGAGAADVLFEDDDIAGGIELLQAQRGPEPDETSAENGDAGAVRAAEGRSVGCVTRDLLKPE